MPADRFADAGLPGHRAGTSYRVIPWQMGVVAKLLRLLPNALFDRSWPRRGSQAAAHLNQLAA
jgi:hypothetical protein